MAASPSNFRAIDPILTEAVYGAVPSTQGLLCEQGVVNTIAVEEGQQTGTLWVETRDAYMGREGDGDLSRGPGAPHKAVGDFAPFSETYRVVNRFGLKMALPVEFVRENQTPFDLKVRQATQLERARLIRRENSLATLLQTAANFNRALDIPGSGAGDFANVKGAAGAVAWDAAGGKPITDLMLACELFAEDNGGVLPDTLVLPYRAAAAIGRNEEFRGYLGDSTAGLASGAKPMSIPMVVDTLATALNIDAGRIFVPRAREKTNREGATLAEGYIFNQTITGLYSLTGANGANIPGGVAVSPAAAICLEDRVMSGFRSWEDEDSLSEFVAVNDYYQDKLIPSSDGGSSTTLGMLLEDCIS